MLTDTYNPNALQRRPSTASRFDAPKSSVHRVADVICFLIPLATAWNVKLIGELPIGEIMVLLMLPICLIHYQKRIFTQLNMRIFTMMGFWLLAQIVTDIYVHNKRDSMAKGWAGIIFFALDLAVLTALVNNKPRRIILFGLGIFPLSLILIANNPGAVGAPFDVMWKFGYGPALNTIVLVICCYFSWRKYNSVVILLITALIVANLSQNSRATSLVLTLTLVLCIPLPETAQQKRIDRKGHRPFDPRILIMVVMGLIGMTIIAMTYTYTASMGMLGEAAQAKYEMQSRGKFGILIGGRPETLVALQAIADAPLMGHGSWPEDPKYVQMELDNLWEAGYANEVSDLPQVPQEEFLIPTHSQIFGAWVSCGIVGGLFWIYFLVIMMQAFSALIRLRPWLAPYLAFTLATAFWDVFFSPFASFRRLTISFIMVAMGYLIKTDQEASQGLLNAVRATRANALSRPRISGAL